MKQISHTPARKLPSEKSRVESGSYGCFAFKNLKKFELCIAILQEHLGYDFYELIPNLDELFPRIRRGEVGDYIYNILEETVRKKNEAYERRAKLLRPDDDELFERYQEWAVKVGG